MGEKPAGPGPCSASAGTGSLTSGRLWRGSNKPGLAPGTIRAMEKVALISPAAGLTQVGHNRRLAACLVGARNGRGGTGAARRERGHLQGGDLGVSQLDSKRQRSPRCYIPKPGPKRGGTSSPSCAQRTGVLRAMSWAFSLPAGMPAGFRAPRQLNRVASLHIGHLRTREPNSWTSGLKFLRKLGFQRRATSADANVAVPVQSLPVPGAGFASSPAARDYGEQGPDKALPEPAPGSIKGS